MSALTIEIVWWPVDPERMLAQILQHALGIRSLHLGINVGAQVDCTFVFDQIAALTQLEVLHIELNNMLLLNQENFYSRLANSCPRIRDLAITGKYSLYFFQFLILFFCDFVIFCNKLCRN